MSGRGRLEIGTHGDISTIRTGHGKVRAEARYRDGDGMIRKVTASAGTAKQAKQNMRLKLQRRNTATGFGVALSPESTVAELAEAWMEDVLAAFRPRGGNQVKDVIEVMLRSTSDRIGESLALRKCEIDDTVSPMQVTVAGSLIVMTGSRTGSSRPSRLRDRPGSMDGTAHTSDLSKDVVFVEDSGLPRRSATE
ncbi:hypothetical protein [Agromyces humatus]|uniref:Uncharacterized protein n=1 Tax=Agromyces humatus TaxID=279573 RepID=A0ABN2KSX3_9MICO|nr:hypothetical protein [Agromyces humatus]